MAKKKKSRRPKKAKAKAEYFVLSCMDYRHMDDIARCLTRDLGTDLYDHVVLAGASLGVAQHAHPSWADMFYSHLAVALSLHEKIHTVVLLEHEQCGAYGKLLGNDDIIVHQAMARVVVAGVKGKHPELKVKTWIMRPKTPGQEKEWENFDLMTLKPVKQKQGSSRERRRRPRARSR
jgi:hypothetical protein